MAIVLAGVGVFVYLQLRGDLLESVDMGLRSRAQVIVSNSQHADPSLGSTQRPLIDRDEAFAQVLAPDGHIIGSTPAVARAALVGRAYLSAIRDPSFLVRKPLGLESARLLVVPTHVKGGPLYVVVGATLSNSNEALGRVRLLFEIAFPVAVVVCSLVGWLLAGAALRPVERMRTEAEEISTTDPGRRLAIPDTDDTLTRLARTLNSTFDRLQQAHQRERRFVDDASHELRTPLTILKAEVDTGLAGTRERADLERTLKSASEEIDHLVRIAEGLLVLARANNGQIPIDIDTTPLRELVNGSLNSFAARARAREVHLEAHADDVVVSVDRTRIRQALDNLLDNALRHTPPHGMIEILTTASKETLAITVQDSGGGFQGVRARQRLSAVQPPNPHKSRCRPGPRHRRRHRTRPRRRGLRRKPSRWRRPSHTDRACSGITSRKACLTSPAP